LVDDAPAGSGYIVGPPFAWVWDTSQVADGTHTVTARFIDTTGKIPAYQLVGIPMMAIVQNHGAINGPQRVPLTTFGGNRADSPMPDWVMYPGMPQHNTVRPYPVQIISPSSDPSLRNIRKWYTEATTEPRYFEYEQSPQFYTTTRGGVFVEGYN